MKQVRQLEVRIPWRCADKSAHPENACISYSLQISKWHSGFKVKATVPLSAI